jgi:tripartite-type tricarboxylate transporter receptor subunit TctC
MAEKLDLGPVMVIPLRITGAVLALPLALGLAAAQVPSPGDAKTYPNRPIRMIVPFPPGGPADLIARFVGQRMSEDWRTPVVIENRPGGNTAIAAQAAARSAPDGYTLLVPMDTTMVMNPLVASNLPYDPLADFAPITLLSRSMSLIVVRSDGPKTIKELIARAKANPGKLNMGAGTITSRLGAVLFAKAAGIDVQLVPFKGSAEIGQAVLAGTVDFALDSTGTSLPLIEGGHYRALAKYSDRPLPILPDLPSLSVAADLPDIGESSTWIGLAAPAGTPTAIVEKVHREVASIYADANLVAKLEKAGVLTVGSSTPAEFAAFIRSETEHWSKVLKESGNIKLE